MGSEEIIVRTVRTLIGCHLPDCLPGGASRKSASQQRGQVTTAKQLPVAIKDNADQLSAIEGNVARY